MASQDLGSLGSFEGPAAMVDYPIGDSLRSFWLWGLLFGLLLGRRVNRTGQAWVILFPLAAIILILHGVEWRLNAYIIFHLHKYICTMICETLRFLALSLAVLLSVSDLMKFSSRLLRFLLVFVILWLAGSLGVLLNAPHIQIDVFKGVNEIKADSLDALLNAPAVLGSREWGILYAIFLAFFLTGHALVGWFARTLGKQKALNWSAAFCLFFGVCPLLVFGIIEWRLGGPVIHRVIFDIFEWRLSGPVMHQSTLDFIRVGSVLSGIFSAPYFVFFWFVLLAKQSRLYRERFARCFNYGTQPA